MKDYRIGPSKLSYDLGGCHRCFAESMNGELWPDRPFPGIFSRLDRQQRDYFDGKPLSVLDSSLPPGTIRNASGVKSEPFVHGGVALTIRGVLDAIGELCDERIYVVDFKSSIPGDHLADRYRAQLCAYQWALEHPQRGEAREVAGLGLLVVCPESMVDTDHGVASLLSTTWIPVDYDEAWFTSLLRHVCGIAAYPTTAESNPRCEWCHLRDQIAASSALPSSD